MQSLRSLLPFAVLTGTTLAQVNPFLFYPQDPVRQTVTCTSFVGRPDVANRAEALIELDDDHFRGIGDANGPIRIFGMYHWLADERLSTPETYDIVIRTAAPAGGPDMSAAAELIRITGITSPPSTNPQRGTWIMTDGFNIAGGLLLTTPSPNLTYDRLYLGIDLPANPAWPATDGHSLFRADLLNAGTGALVGENHRAGAPDPTWAGLTTAPSFSTPWTYILGPLVTTPNLNLGGIDPTSNRLGAPGANLSMNGLFPDISGQPRRDGLMIRITDNLAPFGIVFLAGSVGFQTPYFEIGLQGTLIGYSHVGNPSTIVPLAIDALSTGVKEFSVALPNTLSPTLSGSDFAFQAIVWDTNINLAQWTNAQVVHL
jgi:hypothetical protein